MKTRAIRNHEATSIHGSPLTPLMIGVVSVVKYVVAVIVISFMVFS